MFLIKYSSQLIFILHHTVVLLSSYNHSFYILQPLNLH